jgi:UDP-3-O-[3-hydroxymyristoyl] glucosamine N-acyltransferase
MAEGLRVGDLAKRVGGEITGDPSVEVTAAASLESAKETDVSFLASRRYLPYLSGTRAAAVIVGRDLGDLEEVPQGVVLVRVDDAHAALAEALDLLYPLRPPAPGLAPTAVLGRGIELGEGVRIGAYAVVGARVHLGDGAVIGEHCVVGDDCRIGRQTELKPHVTLYSDTVLGDRCIVHSGARLGVDGYGYVLQDGAHRKVQQVGRCVVEDDVEIGANTTIDRGSVGETRIGAGTKIDNLVHIAHNVRIGRGCLIVAQVGIAGSTTVGDGVALAGQVGIVGHLNIGDGVRVAAQSGVSSDIPAGETYFGYPARPHTKVMRANAVFLRLPEMWRRLRRVERRLDLEER